mgnify:CR=1 FL=1
MIIGVMKEILEGEFRVAATPETVKKLTKLGHSVYIESNAGIAASITNEMFTDAGGLIKNNSDNNSFCIDIWSSDFCICKKLYKKYDQ